jgi:hypothetical protein
MKAFDHTSDEETPKVWTSPNDSADIGEDAAVSGTDRSLRERIRDVLRPQRPVTRKEYRLIAVAASILTSMTFIVYMSVFFFLLMLQRGLSKSDDGILHYIAQYIPQVVLMVTFPAMILLTVFGIIASLGIAKRAVGEFTPLGEKASNVAALVVITLLAATGLIYVLAAPIGLAVSIRAVRRFRAEDAAKRALREAAAEDRHGDDDNDSVHTNK